MSEHEIELLIYVGLWGLVVLPLGSWIFAMGLRERSSILLSTCMLLIGGGLAGASIFHLLRDMVLRPSNGGLWVGLLLILVIAIVTLIWNIIKTRRGPPCGG